MGRPRKNFTEELPERQFEVLEAPARRDMAFIPQSLIDFFAATNRRVSLASGDMNNVSKMSQNYRLPITMKMFGDRREEFVDFLTEECGFHVRGENLAKGDCFLYVQPYDAYEEQMSEGRVVNEQQYGLNGFRTDLGAIDDLLKRHGAGYCEPKYKETAQIVSLQEPKGM